MLRGTAKRVSMFKSPKVFNVLFLSPIALVVLTNATPAATGITVNRVMALKADQLEKVVEKRKVALNLLNETRAIYVRSSNKERLQEFLDYYKDLFFQYFKEMVSVLDPHNSEELKILKTLNALSEATNGASFDKRMKSLIEVLEAYLVITQPT